MMKRQYNKSDMSRIVRAINALRRACENLDSVSETDDDFLDEALRITSASALVALNQAEDLFHYATHPDEI